MGFFWLVCSHISFFETDEPGARDGRWLLTLVSSL
jgi:hypothetical protein